MEISICHFGLEHNRYLAEDLNRCFKITLLINLLAPTMQGRCSGRHDDGVCQNMQKGRMVAKLWLKSSLYVEESAPLVPVLSTHHVAARLDRKACRSMHCLLSSAFRSLLHTPVDMEAHNLQAASAYVNNILLARGLLNGGRSIDFADPENEEGGTDATMARVINLVNDLVLRRDVSQSA